MATGEHGSEVRAPAGFEESFEFEWGLVYSTGRLSSRGDCIPLTVCMREQKPTGRDGSRRSQRASRTLRLGWLSFDCIQAHLKANTS